MAPSAVAAREILLSSNCACNNSSLATGISVCVEARLSMEDRSEPANWGSVAFVEDTVLVSPSSSRTASSRTWNVAKSCMSSAWFCLRAAPVSSDSERSIFFSASTCCKSVKNFQRSSFTAVAKSASFSASNASHSNCLCWASTICSIFLSSSPSSALFSVSQLFSSNWSPSNLWVSSVSRACVVVASFNSSSSFLEHSCRRFSINMFPCCRSKWASDTCCFSSSTDTSS